MPLFLIPQLLRGLEKMVMYHHCPPLVRLIMGLFNMVLVLRAQVLQIVLIPRLAFMLLV
jgi:hypothetical protein